MGLISPHKPWATPLSNSVEERKVLSFNGENPCAGPAPDDAQPEEKQLNQRNIKPNKYNTKASPNETKLNTDLSIF